MTRLFSELASLACLWNNTSVALALALASFPSRVSAVREHSGRTESGGRGKDGLKCPPFFFFFFQNFIVNKRQVQKYREYNKQYKTNKTKKKKNLNARGVQCPFF